jgi:sec-independent protein translocase protein TatB
MFGLGMGEIMIILVLALVLLGPARLPDAAKSIGKAMRDFRKATDDVRNQFDTVINEEPKAAAKPKLVDQPAPGATPPGVPSGGVPTPGDIPPASPQNVPGLDAALAEPAPQPAFLKKAMASAPAPAAVAGPAPDLAAGAPGSAEPAPAPAPAPQPQAELPSAAEAQPKA